jgi:hypothetical protein
VSMSRMVVGHGGEPGGGLLQMLSRVTSTPKPFIYAHFINVRHNLFKVLITFNKVAMPFGYAKD